MSKRIYYILFFLLLNLASQSQDNKFKAVIPASPTAAGLGKYGDIPISYHTGVPEISIPIHTVKEGDLTLPINLNYHSSGVKVEEVASWVGLGWTLNAGGMITRTVVGAPDEGNNRSGGYSNGKFSGWYKDGGLVPGFLDPSCEVNPNMTQGGTALENSCLYYYMDAANGVADTEPDIYNFNFAGYSGKFFFDHRQPVLQPQQDVQIIPTNDFSTWKIVTPDGTAYTFGGTGATERSYFSGGPSGGCCSADQMSSTTWYLTKIENFNKSRSITLNYVSEKHSYTVRASQSLTADELGALSGNQDNALQFAPQYVHLINTDGVRLSNITTSSTVETINFFGEQLRTDISKYGFEGTVNDEARRLDRIRISSSGFEREFYFTYSYFVSQQNSSNPTFGGTLHDLYRLKLDAVQEKSGQLSKTPYLFEYNNSVTMARRLSLARDHWGYYNGAENNTGLIPPFTIGNHVYSSGMANRTANELTMKAWMLKKIQYPTGGSTEFVFEAHRQSDTGYPAQDIVGGLRVKETISTGGLGQPVMTRKYHYDWGRLYGGNPTYVQSTSPHEYTSASMLIPSYLISSSSRGQMKSTQGYHIGYTTVWVDEGQNGKSTYQFINGTISSEMYFPNSPIQFDLSTGELLEEYHEDASGKLIHSIRKLFTTEFGKTVYAKKVVKLSCASECPSCTGGQYGGALMYCNQYVLVRNYALQTGRRSLATKIEYKDGVSQITRYTYSPHHNNPVQTSTLTSEGDMQESKTSFSKDQYVPSCTLNDSQCLQTYQQTLATLRSNLETAIEACTVSATTYCSSTSNWIMDDCRTVSGKFPGWENVALHGNLLRTVASMVGGCESNCTLRKTGECIINSILISEYNNAVKVAQDTYTSCRNSIINDYSICVQNSLSSLNQTDKLLATLLTGNVNAPLDQKLFRNGIQTNGEKTSYAFHGSQLQPSEFFYFDPKLLIWVKKSSATYTPQGNVKEVLNENEGPITYLWGYNNTLPIAQIKNAYANQVAYTSFEDETANVYSDSKTGNKSLTISYTVSLPSPGTYVLTYWKKINSESWSYMVQENVNTNQVIGGGGQLIDEVRLYPKGAMMTTYTHQPSVGITSSTDANGTSSYYFYDALGRLTLIKDDQGNILKQYTYHYKGQN